MIFNFYRKSSLSMNKKRTFHVLESSSASIEVQSSSLFKLPIPIFHIIFGEYLSLKDVGRFDNAVVNHQIRWNFLRCLFNMVTKNFIDMIYRKHVNIPYNNNISQLDT